MKAALLWIVVFFGTMLAAWLLPETIFLVLMFGLIGACAVVIFAGDLI